jgi:TrmH family RNA methyltransferase
MAFRIPLLATEDACHALTLLKKKGFSAYAFAMDGDKKIFEENFSSPTVFVLGNEATGVSAETRALCDATLSIPISERAESLNVAAATAVGLYAWSLKNPL